MTQMTGSAALKTLRKDLDNLETTPTKRIGLDANRLSPVLTTLVNKILEDTQVLLTPYSADVRAELDAVLTRLPIGVLAFTHVYSLFERAPDATGKLRELAGQALALRPAVFRNLELLESLGLVTTEQADNIRAGKGYSDLGGDFRAMGVHLREHWSILEPLQKIHPDEDMRLTSKQVDLVAQLGAQIGETERSAVDGNDDSVKIAQDLMALEVLLHQDWAYLTTLATTAYTIAKKPEKLELVQTTLLGLQRQNIPPKTTKEEEKTADTTTGEPTASSDTNEL